ncbi:MAG: hypothetical protein HYY78_13920 [Betaproteobacteria bacterium]|nr:hypothetical protein [Betaproteobacteria bacterium]
MSNRIVIACILWISILTTIVMAGCSREQVAAQGAAQTRGDDGDVLRDGFRVRRDAARNRIWLLGLDNVRVYDGQTRRLVQTIALPSWSVARFACDPDMVLDRSGSAIVSSNTEARLWRIDGGTFEVSEHPITLQGRERWDIGFAALAMNGDGALLAMISVSEAWWSIDLGKGSARMVDPAVPLNVCGLTMQSPGRAGAGLDAFTNFVPAAGSDYAEGSVVRRPNVALERRLNP